MTFRTGYRRLMIALVLVGPPAAAQSDTPHFHHVHLNVVDPAATIDHYETYFGAVPVSFRGISDAVLTDRSFILLTQVEQPAPWQLESGIYHIGWGGYDGPSDFKWRDDLGIEWETPLSSLGNQHFMYAYGPDREVVEIWTGFRHHRFGHVHLLSDNVAEAHHFYKNLLGLNGPDGVQPKPPKAPEHLMDRGTEGLLETMLFLWQSAVSSDNDVTINIFAKPSAETLNWWNYGSLDELVPTDGRAIDHIAFSYRHIESVFERLQEAGVQIVDGIAQRPDYGLRSFFVRGPDQVLIEIVEARPIPEGVWQER